SGSWFLWRLSRRRSEWRRRTAPPVPRGCSGSRFVLLAIPSRLCRRGRASGLDRVRPRSQLRDSAGFAPDFPAGNGRSRADVTAESKRRRRSNARMSDRLPPNVRHGQDPGGRATLRLEHEGDTAGVALAGAQVLSYVRAGRDVLWTASQARYEADQPVRGGVPLVFPWFGPHPQDPAGPAHGFARNRTWRLVHANETPE